jgi:hypothetical protein
MLIRVGANKPPTARSIGLFQEQYDAATPEE